MVVELALAGQAARLPEEAEITLLQWKGAGVWVDADRVFSPTPKPHDSLQLPFCLFSLF